MNEAPPSQGPIGGKYQLVRLLGRGGMGSVWEARHVSLGTPAAIKFIEAEYANSQEARSRFDKEAKAAATIQSKHAIQIYDHGVTEDGKPYIVMELLQGEPLDRYIDRQRLGLPETARILQQVCRALARAHERGIIHRDLKPENIFLVRTPDDDEFVAKVLDFGIAKMSSSPGMSGAGLSSSTKTGAVLGTPFYMSPEQARGLRNVDHRTDVWSLGVIAFKCLTGRLPFDGESVGDLLVKICTAPLPVPSQTYPGIPPAFDAWFARALEREPERRFANVTELAETLCQVAGIGLRGAALTPTQPGSVASPAFPGMTAPLSGAAPFPSTPSPYGTPAPHAPAYGAASPGGLTNAPFVAESIPGVPAGGGRGKLIAAVMLVSLALGSAGAVVALRPRGPAKVSAAGSASAGIASATGLVTPPAGDPPPERPLNGAPTVLAVTPPPARGERPVAAGHEKGKPGVVSPAVAAGAAAAATPAAHASAAATSTPTTGAPTNGGLAPIPAPPPLTGGQNAGGLAPIPAAPIPAPPPVSPAKKPNRDDPGY